jgi:hypothetical protein
MFGMAVFVSFHPVLSASLSVSEFAAECGEVGLGELSVFLVFLFCAWQGCSWDSNRFKRDLMNILGVLKSCDTLNEN